MTMLEDLSQELIVHILTFVSPSDVRRCGIACRELHEASNSPLLWKNMCEQKFGKQVVAKEAVVQQYCPAANPWKQMYRDDATKVALPTLRWLNKHTGCYEGKGYSFHEGRSRCWIECAKWDRNARHIRLYLDVKGEADLQPPHFNIFHLLQKDYAQVDLHGQWVSELQEKMPGRCKGYLKISDRIFRGRRVSTPGACFFKYDSIWHGQRPRLLKLFNFTSRSDVGDDNPEELFLNCLFGGKKAARKGSSYTLDISPFSDNTDEIPNQT